MRGYLFGCFGIIVLLCLASVSIGWEKGLANSPWPCDRGNVRNTGLSPYDTSGNDGSEKWIFSADGSIMGCPTIGEDGTIYIGTDFGTLHALYPDGSEKWRIDFPNHMLSTPVLDDKGRIYISSLNISGSDYNDELFCVSVNGTVLWKFVFNGTHPGIPNIAPDGTIYLGSESGDSYVFAIDPNGTEKWRFGSPYSANGYFERNVAIGPDGTIYAVCDDHRLYALNPDGSVKWEFLSNYEYGEASPMIGDDGTIYCAFSNLSGGEFSYIYAVNPNGSLKWKYWFESRPSDLALGPDGTIYFGTLNNYLYALYPNGTLKWRYATAGMVDWAPSIGADGTIYVKDGAYITALTPSAQVKWKFPLSMEVSAPISIDADGTVYVPDGPFLHAIGPGGNVPEITISLDGIALITMIAIVISLYREKN